jgi:hypothetical protein
VKKSGEGRWGREERKGGEEKWEREGEERRGKEQ